MSKRSYRGWTIESDDVRADTGKGSSLAAMGRGDFGGSSRKERAFLVYDAEGNYIRTSSSLAAAKRYIDQYNGWS